MAVAPSMLIVIYHMLKNNEDFKDLSADYYNKSNTEKANSYLKKSATLGYEIDLINSNAEVKTTA